MNATTHPLVSRWLRDVERGLAPLSRARRDEVLSGLREHLDDAVPGTASEAEVRNALERLGDASVVAAAAREEAGVAPADQRPHHEWWALFLVGAGSLVLPVAGWLAGIVLVWTSAIWRTWHKVLATVLFPLGWTAALWITSHINDGDFSCTVEGNAEVCTNGRVYDLFWTPLLLLSVLGPLVTVTVLMVALRRHREASAL